jgi:hypothetical protein
MRAENTHVYKSTRAYPTYAAGALCTVTACLHKIGEQRPYFSVTGEITTPESRRRRDSEMAGCIHDHILHLWPRLAPVIAMHLSDDTGAPMHAAANAWYSLAGYYANTDDRYHAGNSQRNFPRATIDPALPWDTTEYRYPTPEECLQSFAEDVRLPLEEARSVAVSLGSWRDDWMQARVQFDRWIETQRPRWQREADAATALLDTLSARSAE